MTKRGSLPLITERLIIRLLTKEDGENIFGLCSQPEVIEWFPKWNMNREEATHFLDWLIEESEHFDVQSHGIHFAIEVRESGEFIGHCHVGPHDAFEEVEISYVISGAFRGRGYATEAAVAITAWVLERFPIPYVIATTLEHFSASKRVLAKAGFSYYGKKGAFDYYRYYRFYRLV